MSGVALSSAIGLSSQVDISGGGGASDTNAGAAFAGIGFESDGDITSTNTTGSVDAGDWIAPKAAAPGGYEIMAHQDSGDAVDGTSSALDTWLALTSDRAWTLTQVGGGSKAASLTVSIRLGSATLSSGVFTLDATAI